MEKLTKLHPAASAVGSLNSKVCAVKSAIREFRIRGDFEDRVPAASTLPLTRCLPLFYLLVQKVTLLQRVSFH